MMEIGGRAVLIVLIAQSASNPIVFS